MERSTTDRYWNARALSEPDPKSVNIADGVQRELELRWVMKHVLPGTRVLEVGCGNGITTAALRERAGFVDAFDFSENMVSEATRLWGETNNRFFHDSVLAPASVRGPYDVVVCIRVLINLRSLEEQILAIRQLAQLLPPGGRLLLVEGYRDGFDALDGARAGAGLPPIQPAAINHYSYLRELTPLLDEFFDVADRFHTGLFDFLTRVVYPSIAGPEQASGPGEFHTRIAPIVLAHDGPDLEAYARCRGLLLVRRSVADR